LLTACCAAVQLMIFIVFCSLLSALSVQTIG
jgi:hypothetical protein